MVYRHGGDFKRLFQRDVTGAVVSDMAPLSTAMIKRPASAAEDHEVWRF